MQHELKCLPEYYAAVEGGRKTCELRLNDRAFAVGDALLLREFEPVENGYTGRQTRVRVTHILNGGPWLSPGYVAMSIRLFTPEEYDPTFACEGCGRDTHIRMNGLCLTCVEKELNNATP